MMASVSLSLTYAAAPARAAVDTERAEEAFDAAMAQQKEGNYREAARLLAVAFAYDNNLAYQYNRAVMYQLNGDYDDALEVLETYEEPMLQDPEGRFTNLPKLKAKLAEQAGRPVGGVDEVPSREWKVVTVEDPSRGGLEPSGSTTEPPHGTATPPGEPPVLAFALFGVSAVAVASGMAVSFIDTDAPPEIGGALILGGVLAMVGGVVVLMNGPPAADEAGTTLQLAPAVGPEHVGAQVFGRF
jgi:hypothetical protein